MCPELGLFGLHLPFSEISPIFASYNTLTFPLLQYPHLPPSLQYLFFLIPGLFSRQFIERQLTSFHLHEKGDSISQIHHSTLFHLRNGASTLV